MIEDIKTAIAQGKAVLGTEQTIAGLRQGKIAKVFITSNCPQNVRDRLSGHTVEVIELEHMNDKLGTLVKKPFSISVIGILK